MKFRTLKTYTRARVCYVMSTNGLPKLRLGQIFMRNRQAVFYPNTEKPHKHWTHVELEQLALIARNHAKFYNDLDDRRAARGAA